MTRFRLLVHRIVPVLNLGAVLATCGGAAFAQQSSLYQRDVPAPRGQRPLALAEANWITIPPPPRREIRLQDIVSVRVDELARASSEGEIQRRKVADYSAILLDWLRFEGLFTVKPQVQADGNQTVAGELTQLYRATGEFDSSERLTMNIAARVADIRPNGHLVLEAHREIKVNNEVWRYSLTGICRPEDVGPDNVVLSRHVIDLRVDKHERGHVRDSYRRGWLLRAIDAVHPF